jgi:hypothetical protein
MLDSRFYTTVNQIIFATSNDRAQCFGPEKNVSNSCECLRHCPDKLRFHPFHIIGEFCEFCGLSNWN